ncbi:MAG: hypothetical protein MUO64_01770 [Anaerolineales bacterium]|nr:hypothetical protein [Anaerolineales bacterium]
MISSSLKKSSHLKWSFWTAWVVASTAGIFLGFIAMYALIFLVKVIVPGVNEDRLFGVALFPFLAVFLSMLQWVVLRPHVPRSGWWIMATIGGLVVAMAVSAGLVMVMSKALGLGNQESLQYVSPVVMTVVGLMLGLAQLLVLYRYIRQPHWWVLASTFGWFILSLIIGKSIDRLIDIVALGAIPAALTGCTLVWLWQKPAGSRPSEETHA